jgi:hypothetical protein
MSPGPYDPEKLERGQKLASKRKVKAFVNMRNQLQRDNKMYTFDKNDLKEINRQDIKQNTD